MARESNATGFQMDITFLLNGETVSVPGVSPTVTFLDWLREVRHLVGTKEGCNEGDCGACTALVSDHGGARLMTRSWPTTCVAVPAYAPIIRAAEAAANMPVPDWIRDDVAMVDMNAMGATMAGLPPSYAGMIRRYASVQVRGAATLGGNIANGSPIGDSPPEDFFVRYSRQDRQPGEFVEAVSFARQADRLKCYKLTKRFDQDISAVCGCFNLSVEDGIVGRARIAFGAMASIPKHAVAVEAALTGQPWNRASVQAVLSAFDPDFVPLSDMRASARYRQETAKAMLVHSSTQRPTEIQHKVAEASGVAMHGVRVEIRRMGGGFGGKESQGNALAVAYAIAARATGQPCKMRYDRDDDMIITGKRHDFRIEYRAGFDDAGRIAHALGRNPVAVRRLNYYAEAEAGGAGGLSARRHGLSDQWRSQGNPAAPPESLSNKKKDNSTPYGMVIEDFELHGMTRALLESCDYVRRRAAVEAWNAGNAAIKKGIAFAPVKFGISFTLSFLNQAGALVHVYRDGSVHMNHGGIDMGQGLFQKVAQVAAARFGIPLEMIKITATDTAKVPNTSATAASSGRDLNGMAVKATCDTIRARMAGFLAERHQADPSDVRFEGGKVHVGGHVYGFAEAAAQAYMGRVLAPLPDLAITWVDTAPGRFPGQVADGVTMVPLARSAALVRHAPQNAEHLVVSYSHALDLELCDRLLRHGFAFAGLIGSATKWARFRARLATLGHGTGQIGRITCPMGDPGLGKHPQMIAIGVAAQLLHGARHDMIRKDQRA